MRFRIALFSTFLVANVQAAITIRVVGTTATQAILAYTAPTSDPCQIEVSEQPTFSPLVYDVDPSKFPGANLDNREPAFTGSLNRLIVVGKRITGKALNGTKYSRALQCATPHYVRITCNGDSGTQTFETTTIPLGMTHSDPHQVDPDNPGQYLWPDLSPTDRQQRIIDPQTGALIHRMGLPGDYGPGGNPYHISGSFNVPCSETVDQNGFYHCAFGANGGGYSGIYAIQPVTGEVRFLGGVELAGQTVGLAEGFIDGTNGGRLMFDPVDANVWYGTAFGTNHEVHLVKFTYHGNDKPLTNPSVTPVPELWPAPCESDSGPCVTIELLTPPSGLVPLMQAVDPTFDPAFNCGAQAPAGGYLPIVCLRGQQDSAAWVAAFDLTTKRVTTAMKMWEQPLTRWCTMHSFESLGNTPTVDLQCQIMKGDGPAGDGPYYANSVGPISATDTSVTVTSAWDAANWGPQPPQWIPGDPVSVKPDHYLMKVEVGDEMLIRVGTLYETMRVTSKQINSDSTITYQVLRGIGGIEAPNDSCANYNGNLCPKDWPAGTPLQMVCNSKGNTLWKFTDPQAYGNGYMSGSGGHDMGQGEYFIAGGYIVYKGPGGIGKPENWGNPPVFYYPDSPFFAGADAGSYGNSVENHPTYNQGDIPSPNSNFFTDIRPFMGLYGGQATLVDGADLYKYTPGIFPPHPQQLETLGVCGDVPLINVSGPNSLIQSGAADNNKFCMAERAGECRPGSAVGDIYVNCEDIVNPTCTGTNTGVFPGKDMCIMPMGMNVDAVSQWGLEGTVGVTVNDSANTHSRVLTTAYLGYRKLPGTADVKVLEDGSWTLHNYNPEFNFLMVKTPPWPAPDGVVRNDFISIPVTIPPSNQPGADNVVVSFGYADNGDPQAQYCTGRQEACVKGSESGTNYDFGTGAPVGVDCHNGCTINVPALPGKLIYVQIRYRDSNNQVIDQGPLMVGTVDTLGPLVSVTSNAGSLPPFLSNFRVAADASGAGISWDSDVIADGRVDFGPTASYGQSTPATQGLTQHHTVLLTNLTANTLYHYRVVSQNSTGQVSASRDFTFTTPTAGGPGPGPGGPGTGPETTGPGTTVSPTPTMTPLVYPNPWRKDRHTGDIIFGDLTAGSTIKIFSLSGHVVRRLSASGTTVSWNRKNDKGDPVASGIYVYVVQDAQGNKVKGKLAVVK